MLAKVTAHRSAAQGIGL